MIDIDYTDKSKIYNKCRR